MRRLVGRSVEAEYRGLSVRCVFSDDTGQRGALGFVCDTYVGDEKSHRTIYSYHASTTHVATTTVGPAAHRSAQSLPMTLFSVKFVVAREASWAKAFFKPSATAAAEPHGSFIEHQGDAHKILADYLNGRRGTPWVTVAGVEIRIMKIADTEKSTISVLCRADDIEMSFNFVAFDLASRREARMLVRRDGRSTFKHVDLRVPARDVRSLLSWIVGEVKKEKTTATASAEKTLRLTHQRDVCRVLLDYLDGAEKRDLHAGSYTIRVFRNGSLPHANAIVIVRRRSDSESARARALRDVPLSSVTFLSSTWATSPQAKGTHGVYDINVAPNVRDILAFVLRKELERQKAMAVERKLK